MLQKKISFFFTIVFLFGFFLPISNELRKSCGQQNICEVTENSNCENDSEIFLVNENSKTCTLEPICCCNIEQTSIPTNPFSETYFSNYKNQNHLSIYFLATNKYKDDNFSFFNENSFSQLIENKLKILVGRLLLSSHPPVYISQNRFLI